MLLPFIVGVVLAYLMSQTEVGSGAQTMFGSAVVVGVFTVDTVSLIISFVPLHWIDMWYNSAFVVPCECVCVCGGLCIY